jgi:RND family efflux transporter MFP subunit
MRTRATTLMMVFALLPGCRGETAPETASAAARAPEGRVVVVRDTAIATVLEVAGVAEPVRRATLSTRLSGAVTAVLVQEGARVRQGQVLARIDDRDLRARQAQVQAGMAEAEAVHRDAQVQARRMQALYADSAATRVQLEAAETGLARAEAAERAARGAGRELEATRTYAEVRAPFAGVVTQRFVDPGAFVTPGAPIVAVDDASRLRISVTVSPETAGRLRAGQRVPGTVERTAVRAVVEGVVPATGALYTVNALVDNARGTHAPGSAATLRLGQGEHRGLLVPAEALIREGDLLGVRVRTEAGSELRWIRAGRVADGAVEVLSGLRNGERVLIPAPAQDVAPVQDVP